MTIVHLPSDETRTRTVCGLEYHEPGHDKRYTLCDLCGDESLRFPFTRRVIVPKVILRG